MKTLPAIMTLHTIWEQQFEPLDQGGQWRPEPALPAAQLINSPYDLDARYGKKRTTVWVGYKVHFTQTCDEDAPQLITHVETTQAPISDEGVLSTIHTGLAEKDLLAIRNISSMRAMSLSPTWSKRHLTMGWTWLAPPSRRTGIKRRLATISHTSPSIGKPRR